MMVTRLSRARNRSLIGRVECLARSCNLYRFLRDGEFLFLNWDTELFLERGPDWIDPDCVFTDIPYGVSRDTQGLRSLSYGSWDTDQAKLFLRVCDTFRDTSTVFTFCADTQLSPLLGGLKQRGRIARSGVWRKSNPSPMNGKKAPLSGFEFAAYGKVRAAYYNAHCKPLYWQGASPRGSKRVHRTQKPLVLVKDWLSRFVPPGGLVLDPFAGSGTTALACRELGMACISIEQDPDIYQSMLTRWSKKDERSS